MVSKTPTKTEILDVVADRVKSTSHVFSVYTARIGIGRPDRATIKQFIGPVQAGQRWCVAGAWKEDPKWGRQFVAQFATLGVPQTADEAALFLSSGMVEGWDRRAAWRVLDRYPDPNIIDVIRDTPHLLLDVPGISEDMVKSLQAMLRRGAGLAHVYAQLGEWGLGSRVSDSLVKHYGFDAIDKLTDDPYRDILEIERYGWQLAESIARQVGIGIHDPRRLTAGLECAVHEYTWQAGNTWLTHAQATARATDLLAVPFGDVQALLGTALDRGRVVLADDDQLYPASLWDAEDMIAAQIARRVSRPSMVPADRVAAIPKPDCLSDGQWDAVLMALIQPISLLTGGLGVGKTTTLRTLVRCAKQLGLAITCMAPTGKAAARMAEATGIKASTIHSRLGITPGVVADAGDMEPVCGMVIVDEVSMLDTTLAATMLDRVGDAAHILLVGDPDQLPSVGPGAVLRDLIAADVLPRVHLDKVYRNDAGIAVNARRIRDGLPIVSLPDCTIIQADTPDVASNRLCDLVLKIRADDRYRDGVLVLTPTNDGPTGRFALNAILQPLLNDAPVGSGITQRAGTTKDSSGESSAHMEELRVGDRVMVTRNSADLRVFNGQVGAIIALSAPGWIEVEIDGAVVRFSGEDKHLLTLAYAITGHKSQGSEAPIVIAPIFPSRVLSREWLYTVLTRAKERCYLIGSEQAMQACLGVRRAMERRTGLVDHIVCAAGVSR